MGIPLAGREQAIRARAGAESRRPAATWWLGAAALAVGAVVIVRSVDVGALGSTWAALGSSPVELVGALLLFAGAFVVRAAVWTYVLPGLAMGHSLAALHVSLGANHVLPFRLGEVMRVTSVVRRAGIPLDAATASTVMLRAADIAAVVGLAAILGPRVVADTTGEWAWALLIPAVALWAGALFWLRRISTMSQTAVRPATVLVAVGAPTAWVMESAVIFAAQVLAVAPAGIGTYEAAGTAALVALGVDAGPALAAVVTAHAIKTAYALVTGAIAVTVPAPGLIGRVRLPAGRTARVERPAPEPGAPVMLFFPAHNEAAAVGDVVARIPDEVLGRPVIAVVIDDGSKDETARAAATSSARVISLGVNRGLGAAVRTGLAAGVDAGAAALG